MSKTATIEDAKKFGACYDLDKLKLVFGKRKSLSVSQIAKLKIRAKDKVWALTRQHFLDTQTKCIKFAIFCAEQCVEHFEKYNQSDNRPRLAIEAAKKYLKYPTKENNAAAYAAYAEASVSYAAAYAANAAYSAAYAANAAASAANAAAYAANAEAYELQLKFLVRLLNGK